MSSSWSRRRERGLAWIVLKTFEVTAAELLDYSIPFSLVTLVFRAQAFIFCWAAGHTWALYTKRTAIGPEFETVSQQNAAHDQQRSDSIHAVFFKYSKLEEAKTILARRKKRGVYVVGFITTLYWRVNPKDEKLDLLHFWPASKVKSNI